MKDYLVPAGLGLAVAASLAMAALQPVPHGHRYDLAIQLTVGLSLIAILTRVAPKRALGRGLLLAVFVAGLGLGTLDLFTFGRNAEIVAEYGSVFEALDSGRNPYTAGTVFHRDETGRAAYGNFNYPPAEIYPYYLAYKILGRWDTGVLTGVIILLNALACAMLVLTFPNIRTAELAAFFPLFLFGEIQTNPSLAFLLTAVILWLVLREQRRPTRSGPWIIAAVFGVGLTTKFLIVPLMAAYYWKALGARKRASLGPVIGQVSLALGTGALIMAPFGLAAVLENTVLFNLVLKQRSALTTFYPNVLSGPMSALGWGSAYPAVAVLALGAAILAAPRLRLFPALLTAVFVFLLAAPTPEPQFLPIVLYLALAARFAEREGRGLVMKSPG
jgi:hypothetical protein